MNDSGAAAIFGTFTLVYCLIVLGIAAFMIFLMWRIFSKAGYNGAMSLLVLIPGVGWLVALCVLAFGAWPAAQELDYLRQQQAMRGGMPGGMPGVPGPGYPPPTGYQQQQQPPYPQY